MTRARASWWYRLRHVACAVCGKEFRKGKGGGLSREMLCSDDCYRRAWSNWLKGEG